MNMLRIFIGFDRVESEAYHVLCHSILRQSSIPVSFTPIHEPHFSDVWDRKRQSDQSNAFSFTRFLTPYLAGYHGWALYMDCDMLLRGDIRGILRYADPDVAVACCQHDYVPKSDRKYLGNVQHQYPRKNWSSLMLLNCDHPHTKRLTVDAANKATGAYLHRFEWTDRIGAIPLEWNWLVGEYGHNPDAMNVHWTNGGPWNSAYLSADYAGEWLEERDHMAEAWDDVEVVA